MGLIIAILKLFKINPIEVAAALLKYKILQQCGFSGPIHEDLKPLSQALDCFALYEEARHG